MAPKLSSELLKEFENEQQERKEYIKNIGIEYRFGCLEEKRADSCHLLGEYAEAIEQNFKYALNLFRENCDVREYPKSCYKYAMYLLNGKEVEPSFKKMVKPLEIACNKGNMPPGCRYLSLVHWNGVEGEQPNSKKAEEAMIKACDLEDGEACWMLSTWYLGPNVKFVSPRGEKKEKKLGQLDKNPEKALEFGIRACELNMPQSCANVSRMFRIGDGIPKNPDKAKEYATKAEEIIKILKSKETTAGFTGS